MIVVRRGGGKASVRARRSAKRPRAGREAPRGEESSHRIAGSEACPVVCSSDESKGLLQRSLQLMPAVRESTTSRAKRVRRGECEVMGLLSE